MALLGSPGRRRAAVAGLGLALAAAGCTGAQAPAPHGPRLAGGPVMEVSRPCPGGNAEVEEAADPGKPYLYLAWIGCFGIGFARSTDGGRQYSPPILLPGSAKPSWDPAIDVAPDGTVYAAFMVYRGGSAYPVVVVSGDHGGSFRPVGSLRPERAGNWGDRDFIAAGGAGRVYLTWDYGPTRRAVRVVCYPGGSCAFATGDVNAVVQRSADGGRSWGPVTPVLPGYPAGGGVSAPLLVEPAGRVDVLVQNYRLAPDSLALGIAHPVFVASGDEARTFSAPVRIGPAAPAVSNHEWWIDGDLARDDAGNLYATWDTQQAGMDVGWLAFSTDRGLAWSVPVRVTPDTDRAPHIVQVAGAAPGVADVAWLAGSRRGYALYLRIFSIHRGWLTGPVRISTAFGDPAVWPGDTIGIALLPPAAGSGSTRPAQRLGLSWGSAVSPAGRPQSAIFASVLTVSGLPG